MVYTFRATIPESKVFYRVYEIKGDMTLFRFNSFITDNLGFSPDQMVMFEGYDEKGALCSEYGLFDMGDGAMDTVTFDKVLERGETELHFVFDLRNDRFICLKFEGETGYLPMRAYPALVEEKARIPTSSAPALRKNPSYPNCIPRVTANSLRSTMTLTTSMIWMMKTKTTTKCSTTGKERNFTTRAKAKTKTDFLA